MIERTTTWVVYEKQVPGKPKMTLLCDQAEWDEMESIQPSYNVIIRSGSPTRAGRTPGPERLGIWCKRQRKRSA